MKCLVAVFSIPRCVENETTVEFFGPTPKDSLIFLNERNILKSKNESQFRGKSENYCWFLTGKQSSVGGKVDSVLVPP